LYLLCFEGFKATMSKIIKEKERDLSILRRSFSQL